MGWNRMQMENGQNIIGALRVEVEIAGLNREQTCEGQGFSPQVSIDKPRSNHLAIIMEDAESSGEVYWILWNVPRRSLIPRNLPKQALLDRPIEGIQGRNFRGNYGYAPPCPPQGEEGHYVLRVYGLNDLLDLDPAKATRDDVVLAMGDRIKEYGESRMAYSRKRQWTSSYEY